jgi:hypothetical protein
MPLKCLSGSFGFYLFHFAGVTDFCFWVHVHWPLLQKTTVMYRHLYNFNIARCVLGINASPYTLWWGTCDIHFDEGSFCGSVLLTFNDSFTIFSIERVDINKIMAVFYHSLLCPWISVEKIILTLTNFLYPFFLQIFQNWKG